MPKYIIQNLKLQERVQKKKKDLLKAYFVVIGIHRVFFVKIIMRKNFLKRTLIKDKKYYNIESGLIF